MQGGLNPSQIGFGAKKPGEIPGVESPMYGMQQPQGLGFQGFKVPEKQGDGVSFLQQGALGNNAINGADGAKLGGKLNVVA